MPESPAGTAHEVGGVPALGSARSPLYRKAGGRPERDGLYCELALEIQSVLGGHTDRCSQYLPNDYVKRVTGAGGLVGCSDKASPQDDAFMESSFKTLKSEEVWLEVYEDQEHVCGGFIDDYNSDRMHSSLGYQSPEEFEASLQENNQSRCMATKGVALQAASLSFGGTQKLVP